MSRVSRSRTLLVLTVCLMLAVLAGCVSGDAEVPGADAVKATVRAYNDDLARGFSAMDMNELNGSATQRQAEREYLLMAALGEGRLRMQASLVSIEFGDVRFPAEGTAQVETVEVWDYRHESLDTNATVRSEQGVVYRLRYELILADGRWLVDAVTSLEEQARPGAEETDTP